MDVSNFFTRLLQAPKESTRTKQVDDITAFDAAWTSIRDTLEHPDERQLARGISTTDVPAHLSHIIDALVHEANRTGEDTTGACLEYFLRNDVLANLERLSESDRPHGIKGEVLRNINSLVVLLSERFLVHNAVHRPLRRLLRSCVGDETEDKLDGGTKAMGAAILNDARSMVTGQNLEADLVDLMCTLCSRMRAYPPLLLIFFHDKGWTQPHPSSGAPPSLDISQSRALSPTPSSLSRPSTRAASDKPSAHIEFLLFSYMLRYVHREGQVGDLARAGLLFLFDIAFLTASEEGGENLSTIMENGEPDPLQSTREALGGFILDGDFADVMAAGLGAIYSLLPSKLRIPTLANLAKSEEGQSASSSGGMHLGTTLDETEDDDSLPLSTDTDVRDQLDLLLKLLGFMQDIMLRCHSPLLHADSSDSAVSTLQLLGTSVAESIMDAMQTSFLDNILYPSILESSPEDGSAVAVMTYLEVILGHMDHGTLLDRILAFLLGTEGSEDNSDRFTLKDLIMDNTKLTIPESRTAALRLSQTLLSSHCPRTSHKLLHTITEPTHLQDSFLQSPVTSTDARQQETELYGTLISRIDPSQTSVESSNGYSVYLADMHAAIMAEECFDSQSASLQFNEGDNPVVVNQARNAQRHRLSPDNAFFRACMEKFGQFLCQTPDENVALTGTLTTLATCPQRTLAGWLLYDHSTESDPWKRKPERKRILDSDASDDELETPSNGDLDDPFSTERTVELPALYQILRDLVRQIHRFRLDVDDFDRLLSERRQGLLFADNLDEAMNALLDVEPSSRLAPPTSPSRIVSPKPKARPSFVGGLKSFLTPKKKSSSTTSPAARSSTSTPARDSLGKGASPFRNHYEQTTFFSLEASTSSPIASGPFSPAAGLAAEERDSYDDSSPSLLRSRMDNLGGGGAAVQVPKKVTLSSVLDNCVILEEFLKEIVAVITARRSLGVDQVGYL